MKTQIKSLAMTLALAATAAAFIVAAQPANAVPLLIGGGWTASDPAGVTYGAVTGSGTSADAWVFDLNLASAANTSTTIHFVNDGSSSSSFFNLTFKGTNTGVNPWTGLLIEIKDVTQDPIDLEEDDDHPFAAHIHKSSWNEATSQHFKCVSDPCTGRAGFPGVFEMLLGLKAGANPIAQNDMTTGGIMRLHDKDELGAAPMQFDLILTARTPEPATMLLLIAGVVGLGVLRRFGSSRHVRV